MKLQIQNSESLIEKLLNIEQREYKKLRTDKKKGENWWWISLAILLCIILAVTGIFDFLKESPRKRLNKEYEKLEEQKRILSYLKQGNKKNGAA